MLSREKGKRINNYAPDYVVFDLETTGTSSNNDAVVEISGIKVIGGSVAEEFTTLVNPGRQIPFAASMINSITDEMVAQSPGFETALGDFLQFCGDLPLIGHNIGSFDMKFLYRDAEKYWGLYPDNDYVDTLPLARRVLPELKRHTLVALADYYGISSKGAHRALKDCRMNYEVYEKLCADEKKKAAAGRACPKCGALMVLRAGKYGKFYGCSAFPACKHTEKV